MLTAFYMIQTGYDMTSVIGHPGDIWYTSTEQDDPAPLSPLSSGNGARGGTDCAVEGRWGFQEHGSWKPFYFV